MEIDVLRVKVFDKSLETNIAVDEIKLLEKLKDISEKNL